MSHFLVVFLGAGLGGALRHGVNLACARACGLAFPWGTLVVNILGCFAMGAIAGWLAFRAGEGWSQPIRLFLTTGILGGFTTFSAFSLDAVLLWERGDVVLAAAYVGASVGLSVAGLVAGLGLIRALT
jgi:fluoride exporter